MIPTSDLVVGKSVCVVGYGTIHGVHEHTKIARLTKTLIILENGRRYRRNDVQQSVPRLDYGGTTIHAKCRG